MPVQHAVTSQRRTAVRVRRRIAAALSVALLAALLPAGASQRPADAQTEPGEITTAGTDFWIAFPPNIDLEADANPDLNLFITAEQPTIGTVSVPGLLSLAPIPFTIGAAGGIVEVKLPRADVEIPADLGKADGYIAPLGIHIVASDPVTVYALNRELRSTDAFVAIPTAALGTRYRVLIDEWWGFSVWGNGFAVVGTEPDTNISITLDTDFEAKPSGEEFPAGTAIDAQIGVGDVYLLQGMFDFDLPYVTSAVVTSDKPVAVISFVGCGTVPVFVSFCDYQVQQMAPVDTWGTTFAAVKTAPRSWYELRIVADKDGTVVDVAGSEELTDAGGDPVAPQFTLDAGEFAQLLVKGDALISATRPIQVVQYAVSIAFPGEYEPNWFNGVSGSTNIENRALEGGGIGDPFMMVLPATDQFLNAYTLSTVGGPTDFIQHYVNFITSSSAPGITQNGVPITTTFREVGGAGSGVWAGTIAVDPGVHRFAAADDFGVFVYGWTLADSYGYPGGSAFRAVGAVTGLTVSPLETGFVGSRVCVNADLAAPSGTSLTGIQVSWSVSGPDDAEEPEEFSGRSGSDASGRSQFCFTPTALGTYSVGATAGAGFEDATTVEIVPAPPGSVGPAFTFLLAPDGTTPSAPTGTAVWQLSDGTTVPLGVSSPAPGQVRYESDGVRLTLTGAAGTDAARGLIANPNGEVECEICALLAAGVIEAWMFSEPRLVAAWSIADLPCQTFTIPVVSPLDGGGPVSAGAHTLQLVLPTASGMQAVNVGVTVGGVVPTRVPAGEGPSVPSGLVGLGLLVAAGALAAARRRDVAD